MEIKRRASCGTTESSDVLILIEKGEGKAEIELSSPVAKQFQDEILKSVRETLEKHSIDSIRLSLNDHGALDCTIRARLECALLRATEDL